MLPWCITTSAVEFHPSLPFLRIAIRTGDRISSSPFHFPYSRRLALLGPALSSLDPGFEGAPLPGPIQDGTLDMVS